MELVIFHYHLLPGGVTGVIEQAVHALLSHSSPFRRIRVVIGEKLENAPFPLEVVVDTIPTIGYVSRQQLAALAEESGGSTKNREAAGSQTGPIGQVSRDAVAKGTEELARRISGELLERYGGPDTVWWIHNHHLGKNPAFTKALADIVNERPDQPIVFHIHDFPECGRYENLRFLDTAGVDTLYPLGPRVRYATINSRDRMILSDAGIADTVYLPNPVAVKTDPLPKSETVPAPGIRQTLYEAYNVAFPHFRPEAPLFLYPVRSIRRKNIFEAALLVILQDTPASLVVTLPGVSQPEKKYSAMVEAAYRDGTIPGLFGIGRTIDDHGVSFSQLQDAADVVISSSVQEGFGYQYISPLLLGKPLVARRLDIMEDIVPLYDTHPHAFYTSLTIPVPTPSLSGPQALLRFRYEERIDRVSKTLPSTIVEKLYRELDRVIDATSIEFSFLLPHMQYVVLQDVRRDPDYRRLVQESNGELLKTISQAISTEAPRQPEKVEASFGIAAHADKIVQIAESTRGKTPHTEVDPASILRRFAVIDFQRLLYE